MTGLDVGGGPNGRGWDVVRPAVPADADGIATMHLRSWQVAYRGLIADAFLDGLDVAERRERWQRILAEAPARQQIVLVATAGSTVVGFATGGPCRDDGDPAGAELYAIYADPDWFGRRVGAALMMRILELLHAATTVVSLWVIRDNHRARVFYAGFGFDEDGAMRTEVIGGGEVHEVRLVRPAGVGTSVS